MFKHPISRTRATAWGAGSTAPMASGVVAALAAMVGGLTYHDEDDRMSLTDALKELESIVESAGDPIVPPSPKAADPPDTPPTVEARECMFCMSELRQVRFRCGHSAYCIKCFDDIKQKAIDAKAIVADPSRSPQEREAAEKKAVIQCPTCREPIGEELAEKGDKVGNAPTFVMQPKGGRGGRGGRGASGRGR